MERAGPWLREEEQEPLWVPWEQQGVKQRGMKLKLDLRKVSTHGVLTPTALSEVKLQGLVGEMLPLQKT